MAISSKPIVKSLAIACAAFLCVPLLVGLSTVSEEDIRKHLNRPGTDLPTSNMFLSDPMQAFQQVMRHGSERVAWAAPLTSMVQQFRFEILGDNGSDLIARSGNIVFLGKFDAAARDMDNFIHSCRTVREGDDAWLNELIANSRVLAEAITRSGPRVGFLVIPSKPMLYFDQLPKGTPLSIRRLCADANETNDLATWAKTLMDTGIPASYPLHQFRDNREDPTYYPVGYFHTEGQSAHDASFSVLKAMYPDFENWVDPVISQTVGPGDLGHVLTFTQHIPMTHVDYGAHIAVVDGAKTKELRQTHEFARTAKIYSSTAPFLGGHAIVIGNSFARHAAPYLATAFDETTVFDMSNMTEQELASLLTGYATSEDAVIFVLQDTAAKFWLWRHERQALNAAIQ